MTSESAIASARRTLATESAGLQALIEGLAGDLAAPFEAAVAALGAVGGRVIVSGIGKSGHVGRKIAATFASTGTPAHFVHAAEASHGDLGMIRAEDLVLALSWSGETAELRAIVGHVKRFRVPLIAITANAGSTLAREADIALVLPKAEEACPNGLAPTTSTTMQMALGDALAVALLERRGFSASDFSVFHPGGKLGAQLKLVREIMHTGARLPLVGDGAAMSEVIAEISAKSFGCAIVTDAEGRLAGIVTDGDLRRNLTPELPNLPVSRVMTRRPRTVQPETLVVEALSLQETAKVTALVVVEDGRPVGLVHYLDLLRVGAA